MFYPVTLARDDNGTVLASFPDVPGAVSYGGTREEALAHALDALLTVFGAFMKDKRDIPAPSVVKGPFVALPALEVAKLQLYRTMRDRKITKAELGRRLNVHLPQIDRILNVRHASQLEQVEAALGAVGKRLIIDTVDMDARTLTAMVPATAGRFVAARGKRRPVRGGTIARTGTAVRTHASSGRFTTRRKTAKKR